MSAFAFEEEFAFADVSPILPLREFLNLRPPDLIEMFERIIPENEWDPDQGWTVINPRGDGNCMLYAVASLCIECPSDNMSLLDVMMFHFIYGVRKCIEIEGSFIIDDKDYNTIVLDTTSTDEDIINVYLTEVNKNTISMRILNAYKYAFDTNIVYFGYDRLSIRPCQKPQVFTIPDKVTVIDGHELVDEPRVIYILSTDGHNFGMMIHADMSKQAFTRFKALWM
jgi:hypothetical protein